MKNIIIYLSLIMISNMYAQCDDYSELPCNLDEGCEWIATYQWYDCDNFSNSSQCNNYSEYGCYWDSHWYYSGWSDCDGPSFQLETGGSCQEVEMPECSEMNQTVCSSSDDCEWIENMEWSSCSDLNPYMNNGVSYCNDTSTSTDQCYTYTCYGGGYGQWNVCCDGPDYLIDNSFCEETQYQLGDLNQDSIINIQDAIIIINLILNGEFDLAADLNLDHAVDVLDVIRLVNIILN